MPSNIIIAALAEAITMLAGGERAAAAEIRRAIVTHDKCKPGADKYIPCHCMRCHRLRNELAALTKKGE